jgi:hypothetical protein
MIPTISATALSRRYRDQVGFQEGEVTVTAHDPTWLKIIGFAEEGPAFWGYSRVGGRHLRTNQQQ